MKSIKVEHYLFHYHKIDFTWKILHDFPSKVLRGPKLKDTIFFEDLVFRFESFFDDEKREKRSRSVVF